MRNLLVVGLLAAAFAACGHLRPARPMVLSATDSGKSVKMTIRQTLTVRLAADPGTGYQWQIVGDPDARMLIVMNSGYDDPPPTAPRGAPGEAWWTLRATGAGITSISFRYVRPWEPAPDAKTFQLTVTVK